MSKTILIVDDSVTMLMTVRTVLEGAGYNVLQATGVREALNALKGTAKVNAIITDLNMPGQDGLELIKEVRATPAYRFVPIIVLTTESQASKKEAARKAGATGWITKPFRPDQLLAVMKRVGV
jgi:two-component system chemotaxis response regulator CheY